MKKIKKAMGTAEEQYVTNSTSKELEEVKHQIKIFATLIKIAMGMAIIVVGLFIVGFIGIALDYAITSNPGVAEEIYKVIQGIITSAAILYITVVCSRFCENIIKSNTPFIPQVPKGLRKTAAAVIVMLLLSFAAAAVYSGVTGTELTIYIDASGWAFVCVLMLLSSIFDYGCKLQQESDETI